MNTIQQEKDIRIDSARMGAEIALSRLGLIKDEISQREAFRQFGETQVRTWVNRGLATRVKPGDNNSKSTYSRIELETLKHLEFNLKLAYK